MDKNYEINKQELLKQLENDILVKMLGLFGTSEEDSKTLINMIGVFTKNGVPALTAMKILTELVNTIQEGN